MGRREIAMLAAAVLACTSAVDSVVLDRAAAFSASPHALLPLSLRSPANTCWTAAARASAARGWSLAPSRALQNSLHPNLLRVSRGRGPRLRRWQGRNLAVCKGLTDSRVWRRLRARDCAPVRHGASRLRARDLRARDTRD